MIKAASKSALESLRHKEFKKLLIVNKHTRHLEYENQMLEMNNYNARIFKKQMYLLPFSSKIDWF